MDVVAANGFWYGALKVGEYVGRDDWLLPAIAHMP